MVEDEPVTSKTIHFLIYGFVVFLSLGLLLTYITSSEIIHIVDIPDGLEEYIFIQRFLNNPECFAYQDKDTSRVFPGIIDLEKFTQENLDYCYKTDNEYGFRLTINEKEIETSNFQGSKKKKMKHILIYKDGFENAELKIES